MSALKRIRDFKAPKDAESAVELRRQLGQFESNVSDMGDEMDQTAMHRLSTSPVVIATAATVGAMVGPGQIQVGDTRAGTIPLGLSKPSAKDAGTFIVLIDLGGSAGSFSVQPQGCKFDNATTAALVAVPFYASLIFCDGTDYWRLV